MLHIHQGNRTEHLLEALANLLADDPADPFTAETVVVQNPGMARWLTQGVAHCNGLCAQLEFPLLASFIWRIYQACLEDIPECAPMTQDTLVWQLMEHLPKLLGKPDYAPLHHYLEEDDQERKRYQLARRIANLFDQYLVFRPDWILEWEKGKANHWQAHLWHHLCAGGQPRHRARLYAEFRQRMDVGGIQVLGELPKRVYLFGLTAMPPPYVEVLRAISQVIDIHVFTLNPSLAYWGDIVDERTRTRLLSWQTRFGVAGEDNYLHIGNPLLASLGKQGRDLLDQLHQGEEQVHDHYQPPAQLNLLGLLQLDVLMLQSRGRGESEEPLIEIDAKDQSIQIHSAHSRMREVQILHDRLLNCFETLPGLAPRNVVVMAPNIEDYAPYIEAVFGAAPASRRLPWSITDQSIINESPLIQAFLLLLDLPIDRLQASRVLGLLEQSPVAKKLGLSPDNQSRIRQWVQETGIRWGLDAEMRAALNLPAEEIGTWHYGIRRLLLGYTMPDDEENLFAGIAPYPDLEGIEATLLGQLAEFIDHLLHWRSHLDQPHTPAGWVETLRALADDLLSPDEAGASLDKTIYATCKALADHCQEAGFDQPIEPALMRDYLRENLSQPAPVRGFLDGRISFCNMVPMRSIPFRVVCLLGMNDGEFPRRQPPLSFDLMAREPRRGDRSRREDDRYLFLEALLSARDTFYLSYIGRDIRSNEPRNPSGVVDELLAVIKRGFTLTGRSVKSQIITEHPLQPFSPRYFQNDPHLFSYAAEWLPTDHHGIPPFAPGPLLTAQSTSTIIDLQDLANFFQHPARYFLTQRLHLNLSEYDNTIEDDEPFALDGLENWQLKRQILNRLLNGAAAPEDLDELWHGLHARGELPLGGFARLAFDDSRGSVEPLAKQLLTHSGYQGRQSLEVDLSIGGWRITGQLHDVVNWSLLRYRPGKLRAKDRLDLWLGHLVLNAISPEKPDRNSHYLSEDKPWMLAPLTSSAARIHLKQLLDFYVTGNSAPLPLFAETSFAFAVYQSRGDIIRSRQEARKHWEGRPLQAGEGTDPWNMLAFRGQDPLQQQFEEIAWAIFAPLIGLTEDPV